MGKPKSHGHGESAGEPSHQSEPSHQKTPARFLYVAWRSIQLHSINASEESLAGAAGQICCLVFAIQQLVFSFVHSHQLLDDSRYVNAADVPRPHESLAFRWVRVIDTAAALGMSAYLAVLYLKLRSKSVDGAGGRLSLVRLLAATSLVYVVASFIDFAQCVQAGGIGRHCHGFNCVQTSLLLAVITAVGFYHPEYLLAVVFAGTGLYRLWWSLREERPIIVQVGVAALSIVLITVPLTALVEKGLQEVMQMSQGKQGQMASQLDNAKGFRLA